MSESNDGCVWPYAVILIIAGIFLFFGSMEDAAKKENTSKLNQESYERFVNKLNFDVDSLSKIIRHTNQDFSSQNIVKKPIFVYQKINNNYVPYIPKETDVVNNYTSYDLKEIKTIAVFYHENFAQGYYENGRTVAGIKVLKLDFFDLETKKYINSTEIKGSNPPSEYNYRRSLPDTIFGTTPKFSYEKAFQLLE